MKKASWIIVIMLVLSGACAFAQNKAVTVPWYATREQVSQYVGVKPVASRAFVDTYKIAVFSDEDTVQYLFNSLRLLDRIRIVTSIDLYTDMMAVMRDAFGRPSYSIPESAGLGWRVPISGGYEGVEVMVTDGALEVLYSIVAVRS